MKAILIARVSTEEQREAGNSLPAQLARLERYCQNKGYEVAPYYALSQSFEGQARLHFR
jgi:DNA invertase Pin-like site-specific DNA recombinase